MYRVSNVYLSCMFRVYMRINSGLIAGWLQRDSRFAAGWYRHV